MYVNPFLLGIGFAIGVEAVLLIVAAVLAAGKKR